LSDNYYLARPDKIRYKSGLPARMMDSYLRSLSDEDVLSNLDSLALVDARVDELLSKVEKHNTSALWTELNKLYNDLKRAQMMNDAQSAAYLFGQIESVIKRGAEEAASWGEIFGLLDLRRKLTESEQRRLINLKEVFTADQGVAIIRLIVQIVKKHVQDQETLQKIADDINDRLATATNPFSNFS